MDRPLSVLVFEDVGAGAEPELVMIEVRRVDADAAERLERLRRELPTSGAEIASDPGSLLQWRRHPPRAEVADQAVAQSAILEMPDGELVYVRGFIPKRRDWRAVAALADGLTITVQDTRSGRRYPTPATEVGAVDEPNADRRPDAVDERGRALP